MRAALGLLALVCGACATGSATDVPAGTGATGRADHFDMRFEDAARWAAVFDDPERNAWQKPDQVVALMSIGSGETVADVGAGTGYFIPHLSRAVGPNGRVLGIDIEPSMVDYMTDRFRKEQIDNAVARLATADDPKLGEARVDRILIVNTWHHIGGRIAYAEKLNAALRPGGQVTIVDFTEDSPRGPPADHRIPAGAVIDELIAAGFTTARETEESLPLQYVVVGTK